MASHVAEFETPQPQPVPHHAYPPHPMHMMQQHPMYPPHNPYVPQPPGQPHVKAGPMPLGSPPGGIKKSATPQPQQQRIPQVDGPSSSSASDSPSPPASQSYAPH